VVELQRRLLCPTDSDDSPCPCCDALSDRHGRHASRCGGAGDRVLRHNSARNLVARFASAAGLRAEVERPGLLPAPPSEVGASQRRPADVFVPSWRLGAPAALDIAVSSPQRLAVLGRVQGADTAAGLYEKEKRTHLGTAEACRAQGIEFVPMVAEPSGGWGPSGLAALTRIARAAEALGGRAPGSVLREQLQQLSVAIRVATGRAVLRRRAGWSTSAASSPLDRARCFLEATQ
jgi:hypothetical protein